jgi:O-antigen/teichoic acid export membrane protein
MARLSRGTAAIFAAKVVFLISGYVLYAALGRLLSTEAFGVYGVVSGVVSAVNMVLINGSLQTVSRFVATHPGAEASARWRAFGYQLLVGGLLVGSFVLGAPLIARALGDPGLVAHLRVAALITLAYAFYAVNVGSLNGRQLFLRQASLDITFSVLRTTAMIAATTWVGGVGAAFGGFAAAAVLVLLISFPVAGFGASGAAATFSLRAFVAFTLSSMSAALLQNLLLTTDLFLLKSLSTAGEGYRLAGLYTAAQSIARIPYYLTVTASLVLFPLVARLGSKDVEEGARARASSQGLSAVVALVAGIPALTAPLGEQVLLVLYPARYADAGAPFSILVVAMSVMAVASVACGMLGGAGRPLVAAGVLALALGAEALGAAWWVPRHGMLGAALATLAAALVALAGALAALRRWCGTVLTRRLLVVVSAASTVAALLAFAGGRLWPSAPAGGVLLQLSLGYALYLGLLLFGGVLLGDPGSAPRRILWVTKPLVPPFNDASKVFPATLARHVDAAQVAICVAGGAADATSAWPSELERLPLYASGSSFGGRLGQNARLLLQLFLLRFRFRALHFFFTPTRLSALAVRLLKWASPGVTIYQTFTSAPRGDDLSWAGFADLMLFGSERTLRRFAAHVPPARLQLARPGVDVERVPFAAERAWLADAPSAARRSFYEARGLAPESFHLLFAGDLEHGGAERHLAAVLEHLRARELPIVFHLSVRRKSALSGEAAARLIDAHGEAWKGRWHVYHDHPRFDELLDLQDAMLFPADALDAKMDAPLVILETLARGKPVFCLDRPPIDEIPTPELRPWLLAADPAALAERVIAHVERPAGLPSAALRAAVAAHFDIRTTAAIYQTVYRTV